MTRNVVLGLISVAGLAALAGCIKAKTVVTVEKDGSGTVEQTVYYKELDLPMAGQKKPSPKEELATARTQAAQTAQSMGEGVVAQSVERLAPRDGWKGMRIVYAFSDIGKVHLSPFPEMKLGGMQMGAHGPGAAASPPGAEGPDAGASPAPQDEADQVRFEFTKEPTPKLTMLMPPMTPPAEAGTPQAGQDQQGQAMAKAMMAQFMDGMLMEFRVKVGGKITSTNATYVSANREVVGLLRMDFGALTKDPEALDKMVSKKQATTPEEVEKQLKDPHIGKYIQAETKERVEIAFE